jgi:hypothetical protein
MAFFADKFEFVELQVQSGATATRYFFPDLPKLRAKMIHAVESYTAATLSPAPSGNVVAPNTILDNSYIVFYTNGTQDLWRVPYFTLNRTQAGSDPFVRELWKLRPQSITWDKSYIELGQTPTFAANSSFCLGVYYS